ncbi:MAG: FlgD immunoglobulin-like domain containing protein, partial [bacterium]
AAVQCAADLPPVNTGAVTASDDCDPSPTVTWEGDVSDGNSCPEVITRTYRATDANGNWAECEQTITIDDTIDPVITCPVDAVVDCAGSIDPNSAGWATATDNCDASPTIAYTDSRAGTVITRTWTATDDCGNTVSCQQTITVEDTTPPTLTCPTDVAVQCPAEVPPVDVGSVTADDDCDPNPVVAHIGDVSDGNSCPEIITRTYRATDANGNWAECSQTITIDDTIDPEISCPVNLTISCEDPSDPGNTGTATATDNCAASPVIAFSDSEVAGACPQEKVITRTWTATDDCGNVATCQQTITVEDNVAPVIDCPADQAVNCTESTDPGNTGTATATDNCDPTPVITYVDTQVGNVITRTWTATDACGNSDQCEQTIAITDTTPPTVACPADVAVQCDADLPPVNTGAVTASDDCDPSPVVIHIGDVSDGNSCPETITRTYRATDASGNWAECTQTITIHDTEQPAVNCPANVTIACDESTDPANTGMATATDNCGTPALSYNDTEVAGDCPQEKVITRTWTAVDGCVNITECTQTITVVDEVAPVITCPADVEVECGESTAPEDIGFATAADNCDPNPAITYDDETIAGASPYLFEITRTWTATDACGNSAQCVQAISVVDGTPPVITCPADVQLDCDESTDPGNTGTATAVDNCDPAPVITFADSQNDNVITRTWTATDADGNSSQCVQTIEVGDGTAPVCSVPASQTMFRCNLSGVSLPVSATHDAVCEVVNGPGTIVNDYWTYTPTGDQTVNVTVRCTDACGMFCEDEFSITFEINEAPDVDVAASATTPFCGLNGDYEICVPFSYDDGDDNIVDVWVEGDFAPLTVDYANGEGSFCFAPPAVDAVYTFTVNVLDDCDELAEDVHVHTVNVDEECDTTTCIVLEIEDTECVNTGSYAYVDILVESLTEEMGGFDLLISYDASAFTFTSAEIGSAIDTWEYFTYQMGPFGNCGGPCPSGLLRLVSIADVNNGPNHPDPSQHGPNGVLATMIFRVTTDQTMAGYVYNLDFYWIDCGDNGVSSFTGDTLFIDKLVLNTDESVLWNEFDELNYPESNRLPNVGAPDECMVGDKETPRRCVVFIDGSICIIHPDSIDAIGDINLNGTSHEIADAVLLTNYIIHGLQVFTVNVAGQLAASDVNRDGLQGSVGDLVYLIRVITGDALPMGKLAPFVDDVNVSFDGSVVKADAGRELGAMLLTFKVSGDYELTNLTEMSVVSDVVDGELKVLLYDYSTKSIPAEAGALLRIDGEVELVKAEAADYYGNNLRSKLEVAVLPDHFGLIQNYPNPFNPTTMIEFALPQAAEITLEVFNISGQKVATVTSGQYAAGYHRVSFDGRDEYGAPLASGIYFYRLTSSDFVETRKMLLIK